MGSILESAAANVLSVYSCPKEGCMRQCSKKAERSTLHDQARQGYNVKLEGAGVMPTLHQAPDSTATRTTPQKEGWVPEVAKKPYRLNTAQKDFLTSKFNINWTKTKCRCRCTTNACDINDKRFFSVSEFLTQLQVSSFFSRIVAKVCQQPAVSEEPPAEGLDDMDRDAIAAIEEIKSN